MRPRADSHICRSLGTWSHLGHISTADGMSLRPSSCPHPSCANISHTQLMDTTTQVGNRAMNPFGIAGDEEHTWEHLPEKSSGAGQTVHWCSGPWLTLALRAAQMYKRGRSCQACMTEGGNPTASGDTPHLAGLSPCQLQAKDKREGLPRAAPRGLA